MFHQRNIFNTTCLSNNYHDDVTLIREIKTMAIWFI